MQKYKKIKHMAVFYLFFIQINASVCRILHRRDIKNASARRDFVKYIPQIRRKM